MPQTTKVNAPKAVSTPILITAMVVVIAAIIMISIFLLQPKEVTPNSQDSQNTQISSSNTTSNSNSTVNPSPANTSVAEFVWQQTDGGWKSTTTPPECAPQPIMKSPADLSQVTSILYPGQTRGGNYKPHGGFRFDNSTDNKILVSAPIDGFAVRGGQYIADGEIQYTFDIMNNCGVMYRIGHLRVLPDNLQKIANTWPAAVEGDSRTHQIFPPLYIKQGETLATVVGITSSKNTFFDWGVYDYRQTNEASKSSSYQNAHTQDKELSWHAVCWFDWLPSADSSTVRSLPAGDPGSGKSSDYCK